MTLVNNKTPLNITTRITRSRSLFPSEDTFSNPSWAPSLLNSLDRHILRTSKCSYEAESEEESDMILSSPNSTSNVSSVDSNILPPQLSSELPPLCILCNIESFRGVVVQDIGNFDGRIIVDAVI